MKRVKKLTVNNPKKLAVGKKGDVSDHNQISIVDIDVLPLADVFITA